MTYTDSSLKNAKNEDLIYHGFLIKHANGV